MERYAVPEQLLEHLGDLAVFPDASTRRLYDCAVERQWDVQRDVDWDALALEQVAPAIRGAMSAVYAYVYYTEAYGFGLCGRLVDLAPEGWLRQCAAVQVMDEARHVDFFSRILSRLGGPATVPRGLLALRTEVSDLRSAVDLLLHAQVIENAAQTLFVETARGSEERMRGALRLPGSEALESLIGYLIDLVGRDESRHIAFGLRYLMDHFENVSEADRCVLERRVSGWCRLFHASFSELRPQIKRIGLSADELAGRVWETQRRQLHRLRLEIGEVPSALETATDGDCGGCGRT